MAVLFPSTEETVIAAFPAEIAVISPLFTLATYGLFESQITDLFVAFVGKTVAVKVVTDQSTGTAVLKDKESDGAAMTINCKFLNGGSIVKVVSVDGSQKAAIEGLVGLQFLSGSPAEVNETYESTSNDGNGGLQDSNWKTRYSNASGWSEWAVSNDSHATMRGNKVDPKDGSNHVINMYADNTTTRQYAFKLDGAIANSVSVKLGNYFSNAKDIEIKVSVLCKDGTTIYLMGSSDAFVTFPYQVGSGLVEQSKTFTLSACDSIIFTIKTLTGNQYLYLDDLVVSVVTPQA